jgi:RNA-directed DNA polymerase
VYDADLAGYFDSIPHDKLIACVRMRVVDGSVLGLIRQWLKAPVVEPPQGGQPPTVRRKERGTPQGGVLSPLLANVYLHWFDHLFQRGDGPAQWAKAKLIRYADDFVVMARYISPRMREWIEDKLEGWLDLQINRDKTRIVNLKDSGQSLDFLGYTFRHDRDQYGRSQRYWNLEPSRHAMEREREALRELINPQQSHTPLPELIGRVNRHLRGWSNYFKMGYPRRAFRQINHFVRYRLGRHLQRRSQRGWRAREGVSLYAHLDHLGLVAL